MQSIKYRIVFLIFIILLYINGLYDLNLKANHKNFLKNTVNAVFLSGLLSILYFYLNVGSQIAPKTNLFIFIIFFSVLFFFWRRIFQYLNSALLPKINLAIIGEAQKTAEILKELIKNPGSEYKAALVFSSPENLESLEEKIREKNIKALVVCDNFSDPEKMRRILFDCLRHKITFLSFPELYERLSNRIPLESINQSWFIENIFREEKKYFNINKRFLDVIFALLILIISLPLWPLIALIIKLSSPGPVFFKQIRLAKDGKEFLIIKFRTMQIEGNDLSPTIESDARVFAFGSFLRKTRLDEIPQLINILRNEMSFIGPRPERPEIIQELEKAIPFYRSRLLIKPGLSGWDQVSGRYHSPSLEDSIIKLQYDLFYLKNRSLYLDLSIALKTLATVLSHKGI